MKVHYYFHPFHMENTTTSLAKQNFMEREEIYAAQHKFDSIAMTDLDMRHNIEKCIAWAAQNGYCYAEEAAYCYGTANKRVMVEDQPYYNSYKWVDAL